jgi:ATP-dependent Lhr-like helicase
MSLDIFHPLVQQWFTSRFGEPTEPQRRGWPEIAAGRHALIAAPTGSGKTLSAFLVCIDRLFRAWLDGKLPDGVEVVYISPLKALSNDIQRNLQTPLAELAALAAEAGIGELPIRTAVRTGDTPQSERQAMLRRPPHILVTTPESLYLLLTSGKSREKLRGVKTVIIDEIHALARDKRGSHLALSLERLVALCDTPPTRIGLSATQKPIEEIGAFLVGMQGVQVPSSKFQVDERPTLNLELGTWNSSISPLGGPSIINVGHARDLDLALEVPPSELAAVCTHEHGGEIYQQLTTQILSHRSTLVFVNTRRLAERVAFRLTEQLGEEAVASHHGSLSRDIRLDAEQRLKAGKLKAIVATASLEMGIDIGYIDLVCQIGSPRSIATFLQRVGRSGHAVGALPKGRMFPLTRDELLECMALVRSVRRGILDRIEIPDAPLDILAQQIVAAVAAEEWSEDALFDCFRRAHPYRNLPRAKFDAILKMLADGIKPGNKAGAYLHRDQINHRLRARRSARLAALTSGGAIPETAQFRVVTEGEETFVGTVDEDFAVESLAGDVFLLGNTSWMIRHVRGDQVTVVDAHGAPPTIPFWLGEAPGRTIELSDELSALRQDIVDRVQGSGLRVQEGEARIGGHDEWDRVYERRSSGGSKRRSADTHSVLSTQYSVPGTPETEHESAEANPQSAIRNPQSYEPAAWLQSETGCCPYAAEQALKYVAAQQAAVGLVPTGTNIVFERFFDESGGMQLVIHAPLGARINKAWGLSLRKRFCRSFDFELQAAADDNGVLLSIGPQHSFPIDSLFGMLTSQNGRYLLEQAVVAAPMFGVRWRWNITRALAVLRQNGGKRVPPFLQKFRSEDLLAAAFPETVGCLENHHGDIKIPEQPIVQQTMHDCLTEAMDVERWLAMLDKVKSGEIKLIPIETREPSPFSHQLLNAQPYAFLDDAPLEERRTRTVTTRRSLNIEEVSDLSKLDPAAIAQVAEEAWPLVRDADELHDALMTFVVLPAEEGRQWRSFFDELVRTGRAAEAGPFWIAAERWPIVRAVYKDREVRPVLELPAELDKQEWSASDGWVEILRGQIQFRGPLTAAELAALVRLEPSQAFSALESLEGSGMAMRGKFRDQGSGFRGQGSEGGRQETGDREQGTGNILDPSPPLPLAPSPTPSPTPIHDSPLTKLDWCERRLLARIHRLTLDGLRRRIEPVPPEVYWQYLVEHHHLLDGGQLQGELGLREVVAQLQGFELPAGVWEQKILAPRLADYDPAGLDHLFLSGELVWGRLRPPRRDENDGPGMAGLNRGMPISLTLRADLPWLLPEERAELSSLASGAAQDVLSHLKSRGALFYQELRTLTGLLPSQLEEALRELAALGLVSSDTFAAVRAIDGSGASASSITAAKLRRFAKIKVHRPTSPVGRWSLFPGSSVGATAGLPGSAGPGRVEHWCKLLLARYGVLFRDLLTREPAAPSWWELARVLRRMELRGEVRGGRFIGGVGGEQFASELAVSRLRDLRDAGASEKWALVSAADPVNLSGVLGAGQRVPAMHKNYLVIQNGRCIAAKIAGRIEFLSTIDPAEQLLIRKSLQVGRKVHRAPAPPGGRPGPRAAFH